MTPLGDGRELGRPERGRGTQSRLRRRRQRRRRCSRDHPWLERLRSGRRTAGLLPLGTRLRDGLRPRRLRPATRQPAVGASADGHGCTARRRRPVVAVGHSSQVKRRARPNEPQTLSLPGIRDLVIDATTDVVVTAEYLGSAQAYPLLAGLQPDLYRCFMEQTWRHASPDGIVALIHPESHFTDEKAGLLREHTYLRLRRHWQFINELKLYEIHDQAAIRCPCLRTPRDEGRFPDGLVAISSGHC